MDITVLIIGWIEAEVENVPAVFVETTLDQRYMETVAENAGV
ncbi:hypothetical protein [Salipaludibacillus sp. CF4.18]